MTTPALHATMETLAPYSVWEYDETSRQYTLIGDFQNSASAFARQDENPHYIVHDNSLITPVRRF